MAMVTNFFLGANSGGGVCQLFDQLTEDRTAHDLIILKGCPGNGKSTFIRKIGEVMQESGLDVEYIRCSGDPASLDGVLMPQLRCGVVDGTAPHVLEPLYPLAIQRYVDLSRFCDVTAAKAAVGEIMRRNAEAAAADGRAGHVLMAAAQMMKGVRAEAAASLDRTKLARRFAGIAARELRRRGEGGVIRKRFLGGPVADGFHWCFDSVETLCARIYELEDTYGLAAEELERMSNAAVEKGWDVIVCLSPLEPECPEHLLIPGLGFGVVTSRPGMLYPRTTYRRVRVDAMISAEGRGKRKLESKLVSQLQKEAVAALAEAREARMRLEEIYRPYVDFDGVETLAAVEASRLLSWMKS